MRKIKILLPAFFMVLFYQCSDDLQEDISTQEEVPEFDFRTFENSDIDFGSSLPNGRTDGQPLTWVIAQGVGTVENDGRDLIGGNVLGGAQFTNQEVENGTNGDPVSISFDYNYSSGTGTLITEFVRPGFEQVQVTRDNNSTFLTFRDNGRTVAIVRNIPVSGRVIITPTSIRLNGTLLSVPSFEFSFEIFEVGASANVAIRDIELIGFGALDDLGHFDCNGSGAVCAVYEKCEQFQNCTQNFSDLVERNIFYVEWDDTAIPSSTVTIRLKRGSRVYDSVTGTPNDGLFDDFGLNFPRVSSNSSGFFVEVTGGGATVVSRTFTVEND